MIKILVASHGPLSRAIVDSASLIAGKEAFEDVKTISITMNDSHDKVKKEIDDLFKTYKEDDEILALTDVYGGSITTVISEYIGIRNLHIITGVNLGMLLEAHFASEQMAIDKLVEHLLVQGKDAVHYVNAELNLCKEDEI